MIKLVTLLTFVTVVWTLVGLQNVDSKLVSSTVEIPADKDSKVLLVPETLGVSTASSSVTSWNLYTNKKLGFSLKHPPDVYLRSADDGTISISQKKLNITISQHPLSAKDAVNTIAEQAINSKQEKLGSNFKLIDSISPIAIGSQTGVTFTTEESGKEVTYFYIPQGPNYLEIINFTQEDSSGRLVSLSDDIIYSLQLSEY